MEYYSQIFKFDIVKRFATIFSIIIISVFTSYAKSIDFVMLRNGDEIPIAVVRVSDSELVYINLSRYIYDKGGKSDRNILEQAADTMKLSDVYMIKYEKRGNLYINTEGKRISGEFAKIQKDATLIYLVNGGEIQAYNTMIANDVITYQAEKPKGKNVLSFLKKSDDNNLTQELITLPFSEVFLIKYPDGSKDIITDLVNYKKEQEVKEEVEEAPIETPAALKVVYHTVEYGETLIKICEQYGVSPDDIINWNNLPSNVKPKSRLRKGLELMMYVSTEPIVL